MQWTIEEQSVPVTNFPGSLKSIVFRVDPNDTNIVELLLLGDDPANPGFMGKFFRNGLLAASEKIPAPPPPEKAAAPEDAGHVESASTSSHGKGKK